MHELLGSEGEVREAFLLEGASEVTSPSEEMRKGAVICALSALPGLRNTPVPVKSLAAKPGLEDRESLRQPSSTQH